MIEAPEARYLCEQLTETVVGKKNNRCIYSIQPSQIRLV